MGGMSGSGQFTEMGGGTGELLGGIIGSIIAIGDWAEYDRLRKKAEAEYGSMDIPTMEKVAAAEQGQTELGGVRKNAKYGTAEDQALSQLMEEATSGKLNARDQQKLEAAKGQAANYERGTTGAMESRMRSRGSYDSGAQTAQALAAQQGGIDRAYQGGIDTAAASSDRALQALIAGGQYARGLTEDDLKRQSMQAMAQDRINTFNIGQREKQGMFDNANAQQDFNNQMRLSGAKYGATNELASDSKYKAQKSENMGRGYGRTAGATAGAAGDMGADVWGGMMDMYMQGGG